MDTKEKIIKAVSSVYIEGGIQSVTMRKVAEKVGIGKSTVYEHFESKEDMIVQTFLYVANNLVEHLHMDYQKLQKLPFQTGLKKSIKSLIEMLQGEIGSYAGMFKEFQELSTSNYLKKICENELKEMRLRANEYTKQMFEKGIEEGVFRSDLEEIDLINFQGVYLMLCAGFSGTDEIVQQYACKIEKPEEYVYERLLAMFGNR